MWLLWDEIIFFQLAPNALLIIMRVYLNKWTCTKCAYYNKKKLLERFVVPIYLGRWSSVATFFRVRGGGGVESGKHFSACTTGFSLLYSSSQSIKRFTVFVYKEGNDIRQKIFTMSAESWGKICEHELVCTLTNKITTFSLSLSGIVH